MLTAEQYYILLAENYAPRNHQINTSIAFSVARQVFISSPQQVRAQDLNWKGPVICAMRANNSFTRWPLWGRKKSQEPVQLPVLPIVPHLCNLEVVV